MDSSKIIIAYKFPYKIRLKAMQTNTCLAAIMAIIIEYAFELRWRSGKYEFEI
jgi:hypothetical protein